MDFAIEMLQRYDLLLIFFNLLLSEGGMPLPAMPTLVTAGALASTSGLSLPSIIITATLGSMTADLTWFLTARRYGRGMLRLLCKVSLSPDSCVRQTEGLFTRFGPWSLLVIKFFPGLTTITMSLNGITGTKLPLFLLLDFFGAGLFVSVPVLLGWLFHDAIAEILSGLARFGAAGVTIILVALALYLGIKWWQRRRFSRQLRMDRITVPELVELMESEAPPLLLDVRSKSDRERDGVIPGALPGHPSEIDISAHRHARDRDIVVYCACPNEASAALACLHLKQAGFNRIRPLLGGVDAWRASGRQVTPA
jgi:membrane protein DedA with SNARE-associated domain/rhodanese-related sulfurtransferase